jgi:hypothetical protein
VHLGETIGGIFMTGNSMYSNNPHSRHFASVMGSKVNTLRA